MAINKKYLEALKDSILFENIDEKKIKKFLISENIIKAKKGEEIISKDENFKNNEDKFIVVLLKGEVMLLTDKLPNGTILKQEGISGIIGENVVFSKEKKSEIIIHALNNVIYLKITEAKLQEMFNEDKN